MIKSVSAQFPSPRPASGFSRRRYNIGLAIFIIAAVILVMKYAGFLWRQIGQEALMLATTALLFAAVSIFSARRGYTRLQRWIGWAFIAWALLWAATLGVRVFVMGLYGADPRSAIVMQAIVNTNSAESSSYIQQNIVSILTTTAASAALFAAAAMFGRPGGAWADAAAWSRRARRVLYGLAIAAAAAQISPALRRANPPFYWARVASDVKAWRMVFAQTVADKQAAAATLERHRPVYVGDGPRQVVLVVGESMNRDNLGLYGYARRTTPFLSSIRDRLCVIEQAYSYSAATVQAFIDMFTTYSRDGGVGRWLQDPTVFMMAKRAGYKIFWISNQDDRFVNAAFASDADRFVLGSRAGARSSVTLDGALVPDLVEALNDPAPLKLIVVHLIGQHPFYDLRFPADQAVFGARDDAVSSAMGKAWKFPWVTSARNQYDNSILYFDGVMKDVVHALDKAQGERRDATELLYISDHAQEVGHRSNNFGHAPQLESGFTIPLFRYAPGASAPCGPVGAAVEKRAFQSHRLFDTLLARLAIAVDASASYAPRAENDLFGPAYVERPIERRWRPAAKPTAR